MLPKLTLPHGGFRADGRLTIASGQPVLDRNVPDCDNGGARSHSGTLYYTPYKGNKIHLYKNGSWREYAFSEISITNANLRDGALPNIGPYDVFAYADKKDKVRLEFSVEWGSFTHRTDAIALEDGIPVKASNHSRRHLGTVDLVSAGNHSAPFYFYDQPSARYVSNLYNAVPLSCRGQEGYVDDDKLTSFSLTPKANGQWQIPRFSGPNVFSINYPGNINPPAAGDGIYLNWVACELRAVRLAAQIAMQNQGATTYGAGFVRGEGDEDYDPTKIVKSVRTTLGELSTAMIHEFFTQPGIYCSFLAFFADGGTKVARVLVDDQRRAATRDLLLTYIHGTVWS